MSPITKTHSEPTDEALCRVLRGKTKPVRPITRAFAGAKLPQADFTITCISCGAKFPWQRPAGTPACIEGFFPNTCDACPSGVPQEKTEAELNQERWESITPKLFHDTTEEKLPLSGAAGKVLGWIYGPRGMMLHGPTDTGKTRAVFLLLKRIINQGWRPAAFSVNGFGRECAHAFSNRQGKEWFSTISKVNLLFIDDFGKDNMTASVRSNMFAMIDARITKCLPTILTTNLDGAMLGKLMSNDRAQPMLRRLRDPGFFQDVAFVK